MSKPGAPQNESHFHQIFVYANKHLNISQSIYDHHFIPQAINSTSKEYENILSLEQRIPLNTILTSNINLFIPLLERLQFKPKFKVQNLDSNNPNCWSIFT